MTSAGVDPQALLQLQAAELQRLVAAPGDHTAVEDGAGQPLALQSQGAEGHFKNAVEKAAVDRHDRLHRLGDLRQQAKSRLLIRHGQRAQRQTDRREVAARAHHLQRLDPDLDQAALQHEPAAQPARDCRAVQGHRSSDRFGIGIDSIEHQSPGSRQAQRSQSGRLAPQQESPGMQLRS